MNNFIQEHNFSEYVVPDLIDETTHIIFVLESPHTDEVKNGYPVAGKSGKDMSKVLIKEEALKKESFGKLIFEKKIEHFGIINVSNIPLQESAYKLPHDEIFAHFKSFRQNPSLRKKASPLNETIAIMQKDFKKRLSLHKDKKLVLCGAFVQKLFYDIFKKDDFKDVIEVPHPSFNNWSKSKYAQNIENLKTFIK